MLPDGRTYRVVAVASISFTADASRDEAINLPEFPQSAYLANISVDPKLRRYAPLSCVMPLQSHL
jgi:hypothetical protein